MTEVTCNKCFYVWTYRGKLTADVNYPVYLTCPRCRHRVRLPKQSKPDDKKEIDGGGKERGD